MPTGLPTGLAQVAQVLGSEALAMRVMLVAGGVFIVCGLLLAVSVYLAWRKRG